MNWDDISDEFVALKKKKYIYIVPANVLHRHLIDSTGLNMIDKPRWYTNIGLKVNAVTCTVFNTTTCLFRQHLSLNWARRGQMHRRAEHMARSSTWPTSSAILRQSPGNSYPGPGQTQTQSQSAPLHTSFLQRQRAAPAGRKHSAKHTREY